MKLTQCAKGHFYDAEKYSSCPHCGGGASMGGSDEGKTDAFFGSNNFGGMGGGMSDVNVTQGFGFNNGGMGGMSGGMGGMSGGMGGFSGGMGGFSGGADENNPTVGFNQNLSPLTPPQPQAPNPLSMKPPVADEGKTVAYMAWNQGGASTPEPQQVVKSAKGNGQPVVGWLVCIDGSNYGTCFNLYGGKNFIGRSPEMDICLAGDSTISRVKHAIIIYEPKGRTFFAQPGESHELFYVNDSVVLESVLLKDRDVVTVGKTTLVFVPFCDSRYGWEK